MKTICKALSAAVLFSVSSIAFAGTFTCSGAGAGNNQVIFITPSKQALCNGGQSGYKTQQGVVPVDANSGWTKLGSDSMICQTNKGKCLVKTQ